MFKPSSNQSFILRSEDIKDSPQPKHPYGIPTAAGQIDPRGSAAAETFALREEIDKLARLLRSNGPEAESISYDPEHGLLQIGNVQIHIKPSSNQGLLCSVLIKNKANMRRFWTAKAMATALDRNSPGNYSAKSLYEAARHINNKVRAEGLPKLIARSENSLRITKAYL